ncbi:MAG: ribosome recycling factor [Bacteroidales bacterium]|nr:ribosome recycling factor [Bacteroidales bacterium]
MMDPKTYLSDAEEKMELAVEYLDESLAHIRAGKANPKILDGIRVEYYGSTCPISNVANISVPDARTIAITPWEKSMFREIEKAIINSELGITPENNGEVIRLSIPPLTEERRRQLVKQSKAEAEQAKVSVRNARREGIDGLKKAVKQGMPEDVEKDAENDMQKLHDRFMKRIDDLFAAKEKEILTV